MLPAGLQLRNSPLCFATDISTSQKNWFGTVTCSSRGNLFVCSYTAAYASGTLQVIAHTHFIDTHANTAMAKRVVPMSLHRYNWDLPQRAGGSQPYFACNGLGNHCSDLQVIAFSPELEKLLGSSASWHEFALIIQGLAALGVALDRAVAWPSLPCNTSWVSRLAHLHSQLTHSP